MKSQLQNMAANALSAIKSQSYPVAEFGGVPMVNTDLAVTAVNEMKAMIDGMPEDAPFVPQLPKIVHGPLPDKMPQFEGIDYPIGGKPR